jgi:hypothetical protein
MNAIQLESKFAAMGARMKVREIQSRWRQGEWFFVPEPSFVVDDKRILRNEPLRRGAGSS